MSSAVMFAQTNLHYTISGAGAGSMYTKITGVLVIDGVEQANNQLEIGAFDQDGICRGAAKAVIFPRTGKYCYQLQLRGNDGFTYSLKIWDNDTSEELDLENVLVDDNGNPVTWQGNYTYQHNGTNTSLANPIDFVFTTPSTTPTEITWNDPTDWTVPDPGANVIIPDYSTVTIPSGCTANAGDITLGTGSSIVIENGGQLYHTNEVTLTMNLNILGYTAKSKNGYRLIASPIDPSVTVLSTGLNTGDFDLYYFDQAYDTEEWRNFEEPTTGGYDLVLGKGYLYANTAASTPVSFSGSTKPTNENVSIPLGYTDGKPFAGWNLIGNPYTCNAYINKDFYRLNSNGDDVEPTTTSGVIAPMEAVFVKATAASETCIFTTTSAKSTPSLNITVNQGSDKVDNAILCFDNGNSLEKFQFNPNHTKVYMPVDGKDYAVVSAEDEGEMPVNFKAEENGTYTLSFNSEDTEFRYLHLIDNMTGNDVDLLATPSYSFNARNTDYASRFKLVFAKGNNDSDSNFGFISDGNLMILGIDGVATLQVIDVTGRILSSETFSGSYSKAINAANGVYMIRLIQGENVRTQKIVVK